MRLTDQAQLIKQMSDREVTKHLVYTQLFIFLFAIALSVFLFDSFFSDWQQLFTLTFSEWLFYGILPALAILTIDFILMANLPKHFYDDGGINEKVFKNQSITKIFFLTMIISFSEEMLFRGVIQTEFGYIIASLVFAAIHFRYLTKVVLFVSVLGVSFLIGFMYELTHSLSVTITAHFLIDFILALSIRVRK
ncbi:CPBP family intramembrane metalloprotease [Halobacillus shinanisalinarum]|uniref:CPBP family intramembrane metalloprotease n=1 Tax=Halobacillus shinanisalinarum TaxID=2932258 RepID=A0ABY4GZJ4_9BACI|nr:type II CAAX endopeptidase family protein [Halobacillus shinanisalinarum]UOQ93612.1 CPBP family intramembrane metalloprotease [Halobacillus shinanisalinarum]